MSIFAAFLAAKELRTHARSRTSSGYSEAPDGNSPASDRLSGLVTSLSAVLPHRSRFAERARGVPCGPVPRAPRADPATGGSAVPPAPGRRCRPDWSALCDGPPPSRMS